MIAMIKICSPVCGRELYLWERVNKESVSDSITWERLCVSAMITCVGEVVVSVRVTTTPPPHGGLTRSYEEHLCETCSCVIAA